MPDIGAHNCARARVRKIDAQEFIQIFVFKGVCTTVPLAQWVERRYFKLAAPGCTQLAERGFDPRTFGL